MALFLTIPIGSAPHDFGVERDGCFVHRTIWERWVDAQTTETLFVELTETTPMKQKHILHVAGFHTDDEEILYVPKRCCGDGSVKLKMLHTEPPRATKLVLQPLDAELYDCPLQEALSHELSNWHCLQKHTTITFACEQLGGLLVDVFVKDMEPIADVVLLRGEVPVDLAEPIVGPQSQPQPQALPLNPIIPKLPTASIQTQPHPTDFFDSMVPQAAPALPQPTTKPTQETKKGFVAFGGTGYRC
jgi:hypothetical protein